MPGDALGPVLNQLDVWWWGSVTNRMAGLTDDEFWWEPEPGTFGLTRRDDGCFYEWPPGSRHETTPPVTTIGWRLAHMSLGCFYQRWQTYFGEPLADWTVVPFVDNAADALAHLEEWKNQWRSSLEAAGEAFLWEPLGDREGDIPIMQLGKADPVINLVLHINREAMHHGAEICLLRDLYRARNLN